MKVFTAEQMRAFDKSATEEYGIPSIVLMENAALRVVEFLEAKFSPLSEKKIVVLCGKGNNGGDGLAIARHLENRARGVRILVATNLGNYRGDAKINVQILEKLRDWSQENADFDWFGTRETAPEWPISDQFWTREADIVVDALLGSGFKGEMREPMARAIYHARQSRGAKVAVDIPSGLNAETGESDDCLSADYTVSFAAPKRGFFVRDGLEKCGEIWLGDIGTPQLLMSAAKTGLETLDLATAKTLLPQRPLDAHKGDAGRALICGGSFGMSGAIALASKAALKSGVGLCMAALPEKILPAFAASILEATSHALPDQNGQLLEKSAEKLPELWENVQVVALGPGLGRSDETFGFARSVVRECPQPLIIDADALYALPKIADEVKARQADTILTPHPGEMGELMGILAREVNDSRYETAQNCAEKYGAWVVLKGARTIVSSPTGELWVNLSGNAGMATGGAGDVLTGTLAGLLAQLKNTENAVKLGVYLHGYAGDLAFKTLGNGLIAGDIAEHLPFALEEIKLREVEQLNGRLRKLE